ncbi:muscarinic acetylcholine receptor M2-like [Rhopilema esculentum]|uniref:muscarinic acetylcholine receptor M2-like n=1 Tax=Rhopilema esculentum TaxID=499914 RepID=UPI0031DD7168
MTDFSRTENIVLTLVFSAITVVGACGNFIVLTSICCRKSARKIQGNIFIVSLALADFLSCTLCGPYYIRSFHVSEFFKSKSTQSWLCSAILVVVYLLSIESILSLTLMSLDRFFAVRLPFWYQKTVTRKICIIFMLGSWVYSFAAVFPAVVTSSWISYENRPGSPCGFQWTKANSFYIGLAILLSFVLPTIIVSVTNSYVFKTARDQNRKVKAVRKVNEKLEDVSAKHVGRNSHGRLRETSNNHRETLGSDSKLKNSACIGGNDLMPSPNNGSCICCFGQDSRSKKPVRDDINMDTASSSISFKPRYQLPDRCSHKRRFVVSKPPSSNRQDHQHISIQVVSTRNLSLNNINDFKSSIEDSVHRDGKSLNFRLQSHTFSLSENNLQELCKGAHESTRGKHMRIQRQCYEIKRSTSARTEMRLAFSTLSIALCFLVTWFPFVITRVLRSTLGFHVSDKVLNGFNVFALMSSLCNPYIILFSRRNIFIGFKSILRKMKETLLQR